MSTNDHDLDQDPVWDLVDRAQPLEANPLFSRNVMREIRLAEDSAIPWWKRLLASKPLVASSLAAVAAVAILVSVNTNSPTTNGGLTGIEPGQEAPLAELNEELDQELLMAAAEDPSLFSDEHLLALLY
jgi:hypothetical protein